MQTQLLYLVFLGVPVAHPLSSGLIIPPCSLPWVWSPTIPRRVQDSADTGGTEVGQIVQENWEGGEEAGHPACRQGDIAEVEGVLKPAGQR